MRIPTRRYTANLRSGPRPIGQGMREKIEKARDPRHALKRLLPYLIPFNVLLIIVCGLVVVTTVLGLIGPYLMGLAIDRFIAVKELTGLAKISIWMLLIYLLSNLSQAVSSWLMADVSQRALKRLRGDLFSHLQTLPLRFFDSNQAGELMSRLTNDIEAVNQAVSQNVTSLLASVLSLIGILIAMFLLDVWLALASLLVVPIMFVFTEFVTRYTRRGFRELQKSLGELNGVMEEAISGQKVVKAFRRNESALAAFRRSNQDVFRTAVWANSYAFLLMPLTNVLGNLFVIVLAGLGGWLALSNLVSVGIIATFINYAQNFISPLRQLANMYNSIQAALAGAERVFELIDTQAEPDDATDTKPLESIQGNVRFDHVSFSYQPGIPIIKDMTIDAKAGEIFALVGPTGAGKTTIINLLNRFYEIDGGRITIDGRNIRDIRKSDLRRRLGLVLQDTFLFSGTVMENIRYGRLDATDEECIGAAKTAGADPFIRQLTNGYHTNLSERAGNLSQGQRQLLSIARAIIADPAILILDEATSSVDTRTEARIHKALLGLMAGRTSFVIAHRLSTIRDAGQVLVIDNGRIVEMGTHRELIERRGFYYRLYLSQFKGRAI
ncbi:MAG: ABC transporter ATP-binding protein [Syntrophales bacterium]|nr:ABC transporter ATP-binding protein [Syntrophales bacterium]